MMKTRHGWVLALAVICGLAACSSDDEDGGNNSAAGAGGMTAGQGGASGESGAGGAGAGGEGGTSGASGEGGASGMGGGTCDAAPAAGECINVGETDITCPDAVGPYEGSCSTKGACCHRSSNQAKIDGLCDDTPMQLEYRVTSASVLNHPMSTSLPILLMAAAERARTCAGEQCFLWRFEQPRMGGEAIMGAGKTNTAFGRYNCDGTFSFYDNTVAPNREAEGFTDPARWAVTMATTVVDPAVEGPGRNKVAWATHPNQNLSTSPFFLPGTQTIDWELTTSGFEILEFDSSEAGRDCQGSWDGTNMKWVTPGRFQSYAPLATNNKDIIDNISQNFCQLLSFSVLPPEDRGIDCLALPRCMPGSEGCKYVKLPDSLCPDEADRANWRCHLGAKGNVNGEEGYPSDEELNCTDTAPTGPLDPDVDPNVSKGQCCDPLGTEESGLPACNAFRIVNQFAAAAAEITDEQASDFPPVCE